MDIAMNLAKGFAKLVGSAADKERSLNDFDSLLSSHYIKLQSHYDMWRKRIRSASARNAILSNGWAFSTIGGLSKFETYVRSDAYVKHIYFDKSGEVERIIDEISSQLPRHNRKIAGVILYGYGNALRETHFIQQALTTGLLGHERVYLLDCSLFYHIFAESKLNPLRQILSVKQIRPMLIDLFEGSPIRDDLIYIRDDLIVQSRPVLHLFLGNTFCNVNRAALRTVLDVTIRPGDYVIAEYANYLPAFFDTLDPDYVNDLARTAAAELFSVAVSTVSARGFRVSATAKAIEVVVPDSDEGGSLTFCTMLRRAFARDELDAVRLHRVATHSVLDNTLTLDAYKKLADSV